MEKNKRKDTWITIFIPFSAAMAASGTLLSLFILYLGSDVSFIGFTNALSSLVGLPLAFIWGKLTDDSGKRKIFILIAFLSGFGIYLAYAFSFDAIHVLIIAIVSGALMGSGSTAKNMYLFDQYPPELWEEKISKYNFLSGVGSCIGMFFGAVFQFYSDSYQLFFIISSILCLISGVMGFLILKDTEKKDLSLPKREVQPFGSLDLPFYASSFYENIAFGTLKEEIEAKTGEKAKIKYKFTKYVLVFFLCVFIFNLGSSLTFTPLSAWMITVLKFDESYIFWIFLSYYLILTISYLFVGKSIDKYGNRKMAFLGLLSRIIAYILFIAISLIILPEIGYLIGLVVILGISGLSISFVKVVFSNIFPRLTGEKNLGEMLAIYSIIGSSAGIIGSFLSGIIAESSVFGYFFLFLISVVLTGLSLLIFLLVKQLK